MGYRLAFLASMLWLVSCTSGGSQGDSEESSGKAQPVQGQGKGGRPVTNSPVTASPVAALPLATEPLQPGPESSEWPAQEESPRPGEESGMPEGAPTDEGPRLLLERLTSMYGVRVPLGNSRSSLDGIVGTSPLTVPIGRPPAAGLSEFAREIVVSVSKREIFVNDYRVGEVVCSTQSGRPCEEGTGTGEAVFYRVREQEGSASEPLVIPVLLKQLQYFQKGRSGYLSVLDDRAASWLMECDAYTLALDRDVPFGILAMLIHTAGFADLTMARLAVVDENDSLSYIPLPSPRLDRIQRPKFHLLGDEWWQQEAKVQSTDFPYAFLAYSASLYPETFAGLEDPAMPSCLPPDVMWDRAAEDSEVGRLAATQLVEHINRLAAEHPVLLGRQAPPPLSVALHVPGEEAGLDSADTGAPSADEGTPESDVRSSDASETTEVVFPPNRVVPPVGDTAAKADDDVDGRGRLTGESALVAPTPLIPQVFLQGAGFRVVLRAPDGTVITAVDVPLSEPDRLYHYLGQASGYGVQFSAAWDTPMEKVVSAIDMLRYRCTVYAMSGRCRQWVPVLPHVLLFAAPGDRFGPMPAPSPAEGAPAAGGSAPATEGAPAAGGSAPATEGAPAAGGPTSAAEAGTRSGTP